MTGLPSGRKKTNPDFIQQPWIFSAAVLLSIRKPRHAAGFYGAIAVISAMAFGFLFLERYASVLITGL